MTTDHPDIHWQRRGEAMLSAGTCIVCLHPNDGHALGCRLAPARARAITRRASSLDEMPPMIPLSERVPR